MIGGKTWTSIGAGFAAFSTGGADVEKAVGLGGVNQLVLPRN